jgi:hypothetical protein
VINQALQLALGRELFRSGKEEIAVRTSEVVR